MDAWKYGIFYSCWERYAARSLCLLVQPKMSCKHAYPQKSQGGKHLASFYQNILGVNKVVLKQ